MSNENTSVDYIASQLSIITEGIIKGTEQRLSRAIFKLAVEVAMVENILANLSKYDPASVERLRYQCQEEVKEIHGMLHFEDAVDWQEGWENWNIIPYIIMPTRQ